MKKAMKKLDPQTDGSTANIVEQNIAKLRELFPDVFTEGKVDFDALRETLGNYIDDRQERYSFTWNGKGLAKRIAQTPSTGTLRPCPKESVNWDTTQNLFIEGDNLEVLKLLQKSYHKKVKMIYIDPPYNTGNEFIYPDKFQDNLDTYLRYTGQTDEEGFKLSANAEMSGRYHTNWLNMMYPRLKLARNLLLDDGVIFISIDDHEAPNLRKLCDELFGEENLIAQFVWRSRLGKGGTAKQVAPLHEYVIVYAKIAEQLEFRRDKRISDGGRERLRQWGQGDRREDRPSMYYDILGPNGSRVFPIKPDGTEGRWRFGGDRMQELLNTGLVEFELREDGNYEAYRVIPAGHETASAVDSILSSDEVSTTAGGSKEIKALFDGNQYFDYPKPSVLLRYLVHLCDEPHSVVLDFFAGSGTTAQAVLELNVEDGGNRRFVMVQLPETLDEESEAARAGFHTIADVGVARISRVIQKIKAEQKQKAKEAKQKLPCTSEDAPELDLGFKVFNLDSSNIKPWDADFDNLEAALFNAVENIKPDRSEADVLYELLLKYGLDLAVPMEDREIDGKTVYIIGAGAMVVCLADKISLDVVEGIAALKDELKPEVMRVVFKDAGFADDVVKTNAVQILRQADIEDVKSL